MKGIFGPTVLVTTGPCLPSLRLMNSVEYWTVLDPASEPNNHNILEFSETAEKYRLLCFISKATFCDEPKTIQSLSVPMPPQITGYPSKSPPALAYRYDISSSL